MTSILLKTAMATACILSLLNANAIAQEDEKTNVITTINAYIQGSSYNDGDKIKSAFYEDADMFLDHPERPIFLVTPERYAGFFANSEKGAFNGRYGKILGLDIEGNIATAKAEILVPQRDSVYIDFFMLKKLDGEWKIIGKVAGRADSERSGEKMLLIASNKKKGEDLSDVISDYEKAIAAGYTVDIMSATGGAITIRNIDMRNPKHKHYIYDQDFLYALENTLPATGLKAEDYAKAHFIRNADARKMKSGIQSVDTLYAQICSGENTCEH